jgi:hypothetical protein
MSAFDIRRSKGFRFSYRRVSIYMWGVEVVEVGFYTIVARVYHVKTYPMRPVSERGDQL